MPQLEIGASAERVLFARIDPVAELDDRELSQIERALARLKQGTYGICAGRTANCRKWIPLSRLNALPYATFCINCAREMKDHPDWQDRWDPGNWDQVFGGFAAH